MYTFKDLAFRVVERTDLDALRQLHNDEETWMNLYSIDFVDENSQEAWWSGLYKKDDDKRYVICLSRDPAVILGRLRIQNINLQHSNCEVGIDIMPECRGKGYAYKSYQMLLEFLFQHFNMNMVYLKVADFNPQAKRLYQRVGFKETGLYPKYFYRSGKYWDYIIMCLTKEAYEQAKQTTK